MLKLLKKIFQRKPKSFLFDGKYEVVPAFELKGETYFMHSDPLNTLAGRGLHSLVFMEELLMRCDVEYLKLYTQAIDKLFSDPKKVELGKIVALNNDLKERIALLAAIPDNVYKLASVVFFTKDESPFIYNHDSGKRKIAEWKKAPDMYSFFLQTPLKDLIPSLALPQQNSRMYLEVVEKINELHLSRLHDVLYSKT